MTGLKCPVMRPVFKLHLGSPHPPVLGACKSEFVSSPLTFKDLISLNGSHRVTITEAMKKLAYAGKINNEGRSFTLLTASVLSN